MLGEIISLGNFLKSLWIDISKRGKIAIVCRLMIIPKGMERLYFIKDKIDSDFLIIYKIDVVNSGEEKRYLELSIREEFGQSKEYIKKPFLSIKNPVIKYGQNHFELAMLSKLQPIEDMVNKKQYVFLTDVKGYFVKKGVELTKFDPKPFSYSTTQSALKKGKIKNMEEELNNWSFFP